MITATAVATHITSKGYDLAQFAKHLTAVLIYIFLFVQFIIPWLLRRFSVFVITCAHVESFPSEKISDLEGIYYDPVEKSLCMEDRFKETNLKLLLERIGNNPTLEKLIRDLYERSKRDTGKLIGLFEAILLLSVIFYTGKMNIIGWYLAAKFIALNARGKENQQYYILGTLINISFLTIYALLCLSLWRRVIP